MHKLSLPSVALMALALSACQNSDEPQATTSPTTATGVFKDHNVSGATYVSGRQTGITGTNGSFTYEAGNTVTFSVGGVTLGTANGGAVVTPVDLVTNASANSPQVRNIVRFLMMLDSDADPGNGIQISSAVRTLANSWGQVDFNSANLDTEPGLASIIAQVASVNPSTPSLPNNQTAQAHIESTLFCINAGAYIGTFTGSEQGRFGFRVDALNNQVNVISFRTLPVSATPITLTGDKNINPAFFAITPSYLKAFVSGRLDIDDLNSNADVTEIETTYTGRFPTARSVNEGDFSSIDSVNGSWSNNIAGTLGTFSGSRIGGASNTPYRFATNYTANSGPADAGLYTFDINGSNVTGVAYSVVNNTQENLSGTLTGTSLVVNTTSGITITATLDTSAGTIANGRWNGAGASGTFTGNGCRLN